MISLRFVIVAAAAAACSPWSARAQAAAPTVAASGVSARSISRVRLSVATRPLQRGDTLRAEDMSVVDTVITWRWSVAPDTTRAQVGWVARRAIAVGEVLRAPAVGAPSLIVAGERVSVIYQDGPVRVVLAGIATNSAPLGASIGVRIDPVRRLDGTAVGPHTVRLR